MQKLQNAQQFNDIIAGDKRVVVKFYTTWCPDCVRIDQFLPEIIEENEKFAWFEINRDDVPELGEKYQVMGIPSLLVFENGEKIGHLHSANAKTPEQVEEFLSNY